MIVLLEYVTVDLLNLLYDFLMRGHYMCVYGPYAITRISVYNDDHHMIFLLN